MKAKTIKESYGSGFSMTGGMTRGTSGRGGGFGGSSNLGGPNMMYTYSIVPLNTVLQQKQVARDQVEDIHTGLAVRGKKLNDEKGKYRTGHIIEIKKSENGSLKYYVILDDKTGTKMKLNPSTTTIINNTPLMADMNTFGDDVDIESEREKAKLKEGRLVPESLDQLMETINFERGLDPKKAMGIGLERFESLEEAGQYVLDNLEEITGYSEVISDPKDNYMMRPKLLKKIEKWFNKNKYRIDELSGDDDDDFQNFFEPFIDYDR